MVANTVTQLALCRLGYYQAVNGAKQKIIMNVRTKYG